MIRSSDRSAEKSGVNQLKRMRLSDEFMEFMMEFILWNVFYFYKHEEVEE